MSAPTSLASIALLGTARDAPFPEAPHSLLAAPWQAIDTTNRPRAVLQAAALEAIAHRAGTQVTTGLALPEKADTEARHFIPDAAVLAAQRMLNGDFSQGFDEWLSAATDANLAAPHRILPDLLDKGTHDSKRRPLITQIVGTRGIWMARQNEQWAWLLQTSSVPDDAWETGSPDERVAWLRQTRSSDPHRAAEAIAADWKNESAELREAITQLAAQSPHAADIPWLEAHALRERRQSTRLAANLALVQVPESPFLQRATARIQQLLTYRRSGLSKVLTLNPPEAFDSTWQVDGIREKAPQGTGEKAWWMSQLLTQIPISHWAQILDLPLAKILNAKLDPDWATVIQGAWTDAAQRFDDPEFVTLLLPQLIEKDSKATQHVHSLLPTCLATLDLATVAELLEQFKLPPPTLISLLVQLRPQIDPNKHKKLFKTLQTCWSDKALYLTRPDAVALAYCPTPDTLPGLLQAIAKLPDLSATAEEFARALEFRQSYLPSLLNH